MTEPSLRQREALSYLNDKVTNFIGYGGAAFGGKSYLMCNWLPHMALAYPGTGWGLCRKELVTLKKTTLLTLFKVFAEMNIVEGRDYTFNGQLNVIRFSNGSDIFLIDMAYKPSDPLYTRFGGYELTGAAIDESAECPLEAINILFTRLGRRNNKKYGLQKKLLEAFNPVKNHVYTRYYKPSVEGNLKPTYAFIKALPKDNPSPEVEDYIKGIVDNADRVTIERLINGNFEYDEDPTQLIEHDSALNLFTNTHAEKGKKYITADIAFHGSDLFVLFVWDGWQVIDAHVCQKANAKEIEAIIRKLCDLHKVPQTQVCYDADGIGSFLRGYLANARSFNNGATPIEQVNKKLNYNNLKSQCFFILADKINKAEVYISEAVASKKIGGLTIREAILEEVPSIKREQSIDGKLKIISKDEMKKLIGHSPDYMDALMMRAYFDLKQTSFAKPRLTISKI